MQRANSASVGRAATCCYADAWAGGAWQNLKVMAAFLRGNSCLHHFQARKACHNRLHIAAVASQVVLWLGQQLSGAHSTHNCPLPTHYHSGCSPVAVSRNAPSRQAAAQGSGRHM